MNLSEFDSQSLHRKKSYPCHLLGKYGSKWGFLEEDDKTGTTRSPNEEIPYEKSPTVGKS